LGLLLVWQHLLLLLLLLSLLLLLRHEHLLLLLSLLLLSLLLLHQHLLLLCLLGLLLLLNLQHLLLLLLLLASAPAASSHQAWRLRLLRGQPRHNQTRRPHAHSWSHPKSEARGQTTGTKP
jgi:hypothetical protein